MHAFGKTGPLYVVVSHTQLTHSPSIGKVYAGEGEFAFSYLQRERCKPLCLQNLHDLAVSNTDCRSFVVALATARVGGGKTERDGRSVDVGASRGDAELMFVDVVDCLLLVKRIKGIYASKAYTMR